MRLASHGDSGTRTGRAARATCSPRAGAGTSRRSSSKLATSCTSRGCAALAPATGSSSAAGAVARARRHRLCVYLHQLWAPGSSNLGAQCATARRDHTLPALPTPTPIAARWSKITATCCMQVSRRERRTPRAAVRHQRRRRDISGCSASTSTAVRSQRQKQRRQCTTTPTRAPTLQWPWCQLTGAVHKMMRRSEAMLAGS
ncbi:hypothetical protein ACQ4PT_038952 [Festuca glaucescens]